MKKKLLTVLLAVVMVFGVFGLTACGGSNPDEEYNYYASRYSVEGDVHITAVTYLSVYKMLQTSGNFILYVDSEDGKDADIATRFQAVNKLADEWKVEVYHFNPDLSGRYMEDVDVSKIANAGQTSKISSNVLDSDIPEIEHVTTGILNLRKQLIGLTPGSITWADVEDHQLLAITGKEASYKVVKNATDETKMEVATTYNGKIVAAKDYTKGAEVIAAVAQKVPSYGQVVEGDKKGVDVPYVASAYDTRNINTFNIFGDGRFHMYGDVNDKTTDHYTEEKTDVFVALANYKQFAWLLDHNDGYFAVFFGGAWCPNTQAIATLTSSMAKDYGMSKVYFFDPILDDCAWKHVATAVPKTELSVADQLAIQNGDMTAAYEVSVNKESWSNVSGYSINTRSFDYGWTEDGWTLGGRASSYSSNYSFSHLYGYFLRDYLDAGKEGGYKSYWNLTSNEANALTIKIDGKDETFGKMAVPNIMIFNGANEGEGAQKAKLLKWAEAEYNYGIELQAELWNKAVREVFDLNPYASYNPIPVIESSNEEESSSSSSSKAPAADTGSAC